MIATITKTDTHSRWYCPTMGGYVLISRMTDSHLLNAVNMCIQRKGHKHRKFVFLVSEARRRGLPLPEHKWIRTPSGTIVPDVPAPTEETPDYFYK